MIENGRHRLVEEKNCGRDAKNERTCAVRVVGRMPSLIVCLIQLLLGGNYGIFSIFKKQS